MPKLTYIALGSNLGDPEENLRKAAVELQKLSRSPLVGSSIWWSSPEGFDEAVDEFCNAVASAEVDIPADELLARLKNIERQFGRQRESDGSYLSRTLDLDIIDYDNTVLETDGLKLPHPRAHLRRFVLLPLQEVAPDYRFPDERGSDLETLIGNAPANPMRKSIPLIPSA